MPITTSYELDLLIEKATSEAIPDGELDLPVALEVSDIIRSKSIPHKDCMRCLKKRVMTTYSNPNTQLSSWKLTDICIKNGGVSFIKEICSREFMDTMESTVLKNKRNEEVTEIVTRIIYELYMAFRNDSQLNYVAKVHDKLASRGIRFPDNLPDSNAATALFDSKTPADWVESDACMICSDKFSILNRRHHCRSCGGIFCQNHSSHIIALPDLGIYDQVRVCDNCYDDYDIKKSNGPKHKPHRRKHRKRHSKSDADGYDEEEQLRKAIEISLRETRGTTELIMPVINDSYDFPVSNIEEEEEDSDLKAAIAASLKESKVSKQRNTASFEAYQQPQIIQSETYPDYELAPDEDNDIYLFASLVEKMKTKSPTEILEDHQLQALYKKVIQYRPKLNYSLNDTVNRYNTLIDMNGKISDVMNIYDDLLEKQLNAINISNQYSVPQVPTDSYVQYHQSVVQQQHHIIEPQQHAAYYQSNQYIQQKQMVNQSQLQSTHGDLKRTVLDAQTQQTNLTVSEPHYPGDQEEITMVKTQSFSQPRELPREETIDKHIETLETVSSDEPISTATTRDVNITQFDFPTVPISKANVSLSLQADPEEADESPDIQNEELLLEL